MIKGILFFIGLGYAATRLLNKKEAVENLTYDIGYIKILKSKKDTVLKFLAKVAIGGIPFEIGLIIHNPNDSKLSFRSFIGKMYYENKLLSNFKTTIDPKSNTQINIESGDTTVPIRFNMSTGTSVTMIIDIIESYLIKKSSYLPALKLKGNVNISNILIPVDYELNASI